MLQWLEQSEGQGMVGGDTRKVDKGQTTQSLLCHGEDSEFCSESEGKPLGDFKQENYII